MKRFTGFLQDENGAVSVDWVLLTAAVAVLASAMALMLGDSSTDLASDLGTYMDNTNITP